MILPVLAFNHPFLALPAAVILKELPEKYRHRLRTTNMVERLNEEVRRREKVIRIFPNEASAQRLIGALLAEQHEVWFTASAARKTTPQAGKVG